VSLLAPFAPHLAEALHERLGGTGSIMDAGWPAFDPALLVEDEAEIVVQVSGKVRGKVRVPRHAGQDAVAAAALADPAIAKFVNGTPKKIVYVPGRLLNLVA
jgi:leucyl-tRNA synthetase